MKNKRAECDAKGNNLVETYATKTELKTYATKTELEKYFLKTAIKVEMIDEVPNLILEFGGKKYKFIGSEG